MEEWWGKEYELISKAEIRQHDLLKIVEDSHIYLRSGVSNVFELCQKLKIPITVLSAGLGNFVEIVLSQLPHATYQLKSNFLTFDNSGMFRGFSQPLIHSENKSAAVSDLNTNAVISIGDMLSVNYN